MPLFSGYLCGLAVHAEFPFPEMVAAEVSPEVVIRRGTVVIPPDARCEEYPDIGLRRLSLSEKSYLAREESGPVCAADRRELRVDPSVNLDDPVERAFILTMGLGMLLHQRGRLILHACAVQIGGQAVGFLGVSGAGKSTLAWAFYTRGHPLISEDFLQIGFDPPGAPQVYPALPTVRLLPDAVDHFRRHGPMPDATAVNGEKQYLPVRRLLQGPMPLSRLYLLEDGPELTVTPLSPKDAFLGGMYHAFFGTFAHLNGRGDDHFRRCAELARQVPFFRLTRPRVDHAMPDVIAAIEKAVSPDAPVGVGV